MKQIITLSAGILLMSASCQVSAQCKIPAPTQKKTSCEPRWTCRLPINYEPIEEITKGEPETITEIITVNPEPQVISCWIGDITVIDNVIDEEDAISALDDNVYYNHCLKPVWYEETGNTMKEEPHGGCKDITTPMQPITGETQTLCIVLGCESHVMDLPHNGHNYNPVQQTQPLVSRCGLITATDLNKTKQEVEGVDIPFICGFSLMNYETVQDEIKPEPTNIMGYDGLEYCLTCSKPINKDQDIIVDDINGEMLIEQSLQDIDERMLTNCQVPNFKCTEALIERKIDIRPHAACAHPVQTGIHTNDLGNEYIISMDNVEWCICKENEVITEEDEEIVYMMGELPVDEIEMEEAIEIIEEKPLIIDTPVELEGVKEIEISCCIMMKYYEYPEEFLIEEPVEIIEEVIDAPKVLTVAVEDHSPVSVTAYPNPFMEKAVLRINNYDNEPYTVSVVDATGKVVDFSQGQLQASYTFDGSNLQTGVYFYTIVSDSQNIKASGRLVMQ